MFDEKLEAPAARGQGTGAADAIARLEEALERRNRELKQAGQRAQELTRRLAFVTTASAAGLWEWDADTRKFLWNERLLDLYGMPPGARSGSLPDWLHHVHPDDRGRAQARMEALLAGAEENGGEFQVRRTDGAALRLETRTLALRDADGRLRQVIGAERELAPAGPAAGEQRWQLAIEATNDGVWDWDMRRNLVYHDRRWMSMLGYGEDEAVVPIEGWQQLVHPSDLASCEAAMAEHEAGGRPFYQHEHRLRQKNGRWKWILDRGKIVSRGADGKATRMVGTHTDIAERKDLEQRLLQVEELARQTSRLAKIGGWELDAATSRLVWSDGVRSILEVGEAYRPTLEASLEFFLPEGRESLRAALAETSLSGTAFTLDLPLVTARGASAWVRVLGRAESGRDGTVRIHGTMQNITAEVESAQARNQLEMQLLQAQKMETLGTLAGGIAHDFNNLLTGILGFNDLASDSLAEDHPARACLDEARKASLRARELVEQILTFGRQQPAIDRAPLDLALSMEEARRFLRATLPSNITIELEVGPGCTPVLADATQIHQVLLNLGSNAAYAMRERGGAIRFSLQPYEIAPDGAAILAGVPAGSYMRLSVRDTGHGIDEDTQRRIFDPFFTTKHMREGTGLGLAVVHGIMRTHQGMIDVESKLGEGSTFHVYLPALTHGQSPHRPLAEPVARGNGKLVCVVDDESIVAESTKLILENKGYRALCFLSAEQCLAAFRANPQGWDAIVTDQSMAGMPGTELIAAVRQLAPALPVVLMSGYFSKIPSQTMNELGHVVLLAKPYTVDQLVRALYRAMQPAPSAA